MSDTEAIISVKNDLEPAAYSSSNLTETKTMLSFLLLDNSSEIASLKKLTIWNVNHIKLIGANQSGELSLSNCYKLTCCNA